MNKESIVKQNNLFGIVMMMLHAVALSVLYAVMKELTIEMSSNIAVFLYKASILVCIIPWCFYGGLKEMRTKRLGLHMTRGFLSVCGALSLFYAIKHIGLSDVTAVAYLEQIILLIIGIVYFKESASLIKFIVIALSFVGAVLIIKPDYVVGNAMASTQMNQYYIFVFMAIAFWSCNSTVIKILGKTEKTKVQLFYVMLFSCIIAFPVAFMNWDVAFRVGDVLEVKYPYAFIDLKTIGFRSHHIWYIISLAACYFIHVITHFKALKHAELSVVVPFEYSRLVFAAVLGYIFFSEVPLHTSYYGYALITGSGIALFASEQHKRMKKREMERKQKEVESEFDQS